MKDLQPQSKVQADSAPGAVGVEPGWYPDPSGGKTQRYWDGSTWTEQKRRIEGDEITDRSRNVVSPFAVGVVVLGAALAIMACFLPAAEVPIGFSEIKSNSLVQGQSNVYWILILSVAVAATALRAYDSHRRNWVPVVLGLLVLVGAIVIGASHSEALTVYHLNAHGEAITTLPAVHADPGIGIYILGLGDALMVGGGIWILSSPPMAEEDGEAQASEADPSKRCPDCAESVLLHARVCKHCGYRFEESEEGDPTEAAVAVGAQTPPPVTAFRCGLCDSHFASEEEALAHADVVHTELPFNDAKAAIGRVSTDGGDGLLNSGGDHRSEAAS